MKKKPFAWDKAFIMLTALFTLLGGLGLKVSSDRVATAQSDGAGAVLNKSFDYEDKIKNLEAANKALRAKLFKKCEGVK